MKKVNLEITSEDCALLREALSSYEKDLMKVRSMDPANVDYVLRRCFDLKLKILPYVPKERVDLSENVT